MNFRKLFISFLVIVCCIFLNLCESTTRDVVYKRLINDFNGTALLGIGLIPSSPGYSVSRFLVFVFSCLDSSVIAIEDCIIIFDRHNITSTSSLSENAIPRYHLGQMTRLKDKWPLLYKKIHYNNAQFINPLPYVAVICDPLTGHYLLWIWSDQKIRSLIVYDLNMLKQEPKMYTINRLPTSPIISSYKPGILYGNLNSLPNGYNQPFYLVKFKTDINLNHEIEDKAFKHVYTICQHDDQIRFLWIDKGYQENCSNGSKEFATILGITGFSDSSRLYFIAKETKLRQRTIFSFPISSFSNADQNHSYLTSVDHIKLEQFLVLSNVSSNVEYVVDDQLVQVFEPTERSIVRNVIIVSLSVFALIVCIVIASFFLVSARTDSEMNSNIYVT